MSLEIKGKLIHVGDVQVFDSGFKKRVFVIETDDKFPQKVPFELFKDSCDLIDSYELNSDVNVHFNVRGNEYNGKYYCSLNAWRVEGEKKQENTPPVNNEPPMTTGAQDLSDLPF